MTLQDLFSIVSGNKNLALIFFGVLPVLAFLVGIIGGTKDHLAPYKYIYSVLIYLSSVPGIMAVGLNLYLFLFQRQDIMQTNLITQVLPILSMAATIAIIKKNVLLEYIPGFSKIYGLWLMLFATMFFMWLLERIQIIVFSYLPFQYLIGIFAVLFTVIYLGWRKISK